MLHVHVPCSPQNSLLHSWTVQLTSLWKHCTGEFWRYGCTYMYIHVGMQYGLQLGVCMVIQCKCTCTCTCRCVVAVCLFTGAVSMVPTADRASSTIYMYFLLREWKAVKHGEALLCHHLRSICSDSGHYNCMHACTCTCTHIHVRCTCNSAVVLEVLEGSHPQG